MAAQAQLRTKAPGFAKHPGYRLEIEPCGKRVRALLGGETLADSTAVLLLRESGHVPVYYFPRDDVRMDLLERSDHATYCPFKGDAAYWTVAAAGQRAENAVWGYEDPFEEAARIKDYLAFYWNRMDQWYEEDEEVFVHARDPKVRVDILASSRPVKVILGGETVAETTNGRFLFETGLPTRYYLPPEDVRRDLLEPSPTETACPYKGTARYHSVRVGDRRYEDIVWFYPDPVAEAAKIKDRLCFFNEKVDAILVDGKEIAKPQTKWS